MESLSSKEKKLQLLQEKKRIQDELPHLYGWPWYKWAWDFFNSTNRTNLLCAANQISKSSTQIRKCIDWATDDTKWPYLWGRKPNQFWYLYPSKDVATVEFEKKWVAEFMPKGHAKQHGKYAWTAEYDKKKITAIHFENGVSVYFKTYAQDPRTLQSGSCYAVFCDEELPVDLYDELRMRLAGTDGYFHMVFTATLGQEFWYKAIECRGQTSEVLVGAAKYQVSMYDCLQYVDGSESPWTRERIKRIEDSCKSKEEIDRRVHGRFVKEEGRKFHAFSPSRHYVKPFAIPPDYLKYVGVDPGSGGQTGHPAGIVFIAVDPKMQVGYVYKAWRGDGVETTAGDVYKKYKELAGGENIMGKVFDWASKDFGVIATRNGDSFVKADKSHQRGEEIVNTLFKNDMLFLFDEDGEIAKLGTELMGLQANTRKSHAKDDLCDALRYPVVFIPWDFTTMKDLPFDEPTKEIVKAWTEKEYLESEIAQRRGEFYDPRDKKDEWDEALADEIGVWNEFYGN
jgi:hypothetical protein